MLGRTGGRVGALRLDRWGLLAALGDPGELWVEGVREPRPPPTEFLFLRRAADGWETGVFERGTWHVVGAFPDESAACEHLLRLANP